MSSTRVDDNPRDPSPLSPLADAAGYQWRLIRTGVRFVARSEVVVVPYLGLRALLYGETRDDGLATLAVTGNAAKAANARAALSAAGLIDARERLTAKAHAILAAYRTSAGEQRDRTLTLG